MKKLPIIFLIIGSIISASLGIAFLAFIFIGSNLKKAINTYTLDKEVVSIDSNTSVSDIKFIASTDGTKKVVCYEYEKFGHTVALSDDGLLTVRSFDNRDWYQRFGSSFDMKIEIYLPGEEYDSLKMVHSTGSINVPTGFTFSNVDISGSTGSIHFSAIVNEEAKIAASTGSIHVNETNASSFKLHASTGSVNLNKVMANETIDIETSTGSIILTEVNASNLKIHASTGSVRVNNTVIEENINIETSTGNISLNDSDASTLKLKASTGDIKGTLLSPHIFYATSTTGSVNVPHLTEGGLCEIETTTGEISFQIKE